MSKELERLVVKLEAEIGRFEKDLNKAEQKSKKFAGGMKKSMRAVQAAIGLVSFGVLTKKVIDATTKQSGAVAQLEATWKSTRGAVGLSVDEMVAEASRLQGVSIFGDEEIIKAQSQLATFTKITTDNFKRTTAAALDMSVKMDQSLKTSVVQLGKALNDPIKGVAALSKVGVQFSEDQKLVIQTLVETGRMAEAQTVILEEMELQFGGSAKAARDEFGGALTALGNAAGDLLEADSLGGATAGVNELTKLLSDPKTKAAAVAIANALITSFQVATNVIVKTVNGIRYLAEEIAALVNGPAADDVPRLTEELGDLEGQLADVNSKIAVSREALAVGGDPRFIQTHERHLGFLQAESDKLQKQIAQTKELIELNTVKNDPNLLGAGDLGGGGGVVAPTLPPLGNPKDSAEVGQAEGISQCKKEIKEEELSYLQQLEKSYKEGLLRSEAEHQFKLLQFQQQSSKQKVKTLLSEGVAITQGASHTSRKLFKLNKAFTLAKAVATLPGAVLDAVARGGGWPWGAAFGTLTALNGAAQINAIKKAKFSGGTSASLAGTGGGAVQTSAASIPSVEDIVRPEENQQESQIRPTTQVFVQGDIFGMERFEDKMLDVLARASNNQRIRISDSSGRTLIETV